MKEQQQKAIYKIENLINHKIYIGQSIHPEQRFKEHCQYNKKSQYSLISRAIQKYGKENFSFEIIGWFKDYNEKEQYYITYYNSRSPYGYNMTDGGEDPPHWVGENHPMTKLTKEEVVKIKTDIKNYDLPQRQILKKHKITKDQYRHINNGTSWRDNDETYPLRPSEAELNEKRADKVIKLLQTSQLSQKEIGQLVGWNRSAITMINIGKNHHRDNIDYPIRK